MVRLEPNRDLERVRGAGRIGLDHAYQSEIGIGFRVVRSKIRRRFQREFPAVDVLGKRLGDPELLADLVDGLELVGGILVGTEDAEIGHVLLHDVAQERALHARGLGERLAGEHFVVVKLAGYKTFEQKVRIEKAIKLLESALQYERWQFLVAAEIHGQIGIIKYMVKDVDGAVPALEKGNPRNYLAQAIRAAIAYSKKDYDAMTKHFEQAVTYGKKEGLMWAAYAWCLLQNKEKDKALKVMTRAVEKNPSDEKLKAALVALQNDKKLKMKAWEPGWWQLGLEAPQQQQAMFVGGGRQMRFRR